jgi:HlyD family secretion protein
VKPAPGPIETADREPRSGVFALGRIGPRDGVIDVCGAPGDQLQDCCVAEGDLVERGESLAVLASRTLRELELASIESQIVEAQARRDAEAASADFRIATAKLALEEADAADLDIEAQRKREEAAEASLAVARKDLERLEGLPQELATEQQLDHQKLVVRQAQTEAEAARALLKKLLRGRELKRKAAVQELAAAEDAKPRVIAAIPLESLKRARELTQAHLDRTVIRAPTRGTVLRKFIVAGEGVGQEPILQMADLEHMVVVAEVYEADVHRVMVGRPAVIRSPAFPPPRNPPGGLRGKVTRIGRMISTPLLRDPNPMAAVDRHVVEVRIELDEESVREAAQLVNLQVEVEIVLPTDATARAGDSHPPGDEGAPSGD